MLSNRTIASQITRVIGGIGLVGGAAGAVVGAAATPAGASTYHDACNNASIDVCVAAYVTNGQAYWKAFTTNHSGGSLYGFTELGTSTQGFLEHSTPTTLKTGSTNYTPSYPTDSSNDVCGAWYEYIGGQTYELASIECQEF
jgi:hypothetical protein